MHSEATSGRRPGRPSVSNAAALALLDEKWGITGVLHDLPSDSDQNFRVLVNGTPRYVLRVANVGQSKEFLEAVVELLRHLEGLGTQRVVPTITGSSIVEAVFEGTGHWVLLTEWIEDRTLAEAPHSDSRTMRSLGQFLARMDAALEDFDHPGLHRDLQWDLAKGAAVLQAHHGDAPGDTAAGIGLFADRDRAQLFATSFADHLERYQPLLQLLPRATIHNDPNDHNVLVSDNEESPVVVGILDFGDAVHSFRIADLVIGATYALLGSPTPLRVVQEVTRGYTELRELNRLERHLLLPLIRLRLLVSVTMSAHASRLEPDNDYLVVSQAGAWTALEQLAALDFDRAEKTVFGQAEHPAPAGTGAPPTKGDLATRRAKSLAPSLSLSYDAPLTLVRGWMQYLFDAQGRAYLDCVNNICHVGHSHPAVVGALARQASLLNTNTRYLHPQRLEYVDRLLERFSPELDTCFLVSSGTEANELAWRIAQAATGRTQAVVLDHAYHGNASATIALSPYKFAGPGGAGRPEHVHVAPAPDVFRGECQDPEAAAAHYVGGVRDALHRAAEQGGAAALFVESIPSCGGQLVPPHGFVRDAFEAARAGGAVAVADEVQTGFGRVGSGFWAFELDGARPDIVTLGKPMGNGHPLGAVVLRRELADAFATGMEYFSSFGGNPVSCSVGLAVLDVIRAEGLQERALRVGSHLSNRLGELASTDRRIGDVRGRGLFIGVEFVAPGSERTPQPDVAHRVVQYARGEGVLLSTDGPDHNVIKIKPPLVFSESDADRLVDTIRSALAVTV